MKSWKTISAVMTCPYTGTHSCAHGSTQRCQPLLETHCRSSL